MKKVVEFGLIIPLLIFGCTATRNTDLISSKIESDPFFKALGKFSGEENLLGETKGPISAWREVNDPTKEYYIHIYDGKADADLNVVWVVTLHVVYLTEAIVDTVIKSAPNYNGDMSFYFERDGTWKLKELSPCVVKSDSLQDVLSIDSVLVRVNGEEPIRLVDPTATIPIESWPYTFNVGDSIDVMVWSYDSSKCIVMLHAPGAVRHRFHYEDGKWIYRGFPKELGTHWAWIDVISKQSIYDRDAPDRSLVWGLPYKVE